jgi:hypothetical protein
MQNRVMVLALLGTAWVTTRPTRAQQMPTTVIACPWRIVISPMLPQETAAT